MPIWASILIAIATLVLGSGGVLAWFKLGPERKRIVIEAAEGAVILQSNVLKDIQTSYDNLNDELAQLKMDNIMVEEEKERCQAQIARLQTSVEFMQRDLDRHGRMAELARRKSHLAVHTLGNYELHVGLLLDEMRKARLEITPDMRPQHIRSAFQQEMDKLEVMESLVTEEAMAAELLPHDESDKMSNT